MMLLPVIMSFAIEQCLTFLTMGKIQLEIPKEALETNGETGKEKEKPFTVPKNKNYMEYIPTLCKVYSDCKQIQFDHLV